MCILYSGQFVWCVEWSVVDTNLIIISAGSAECSVLAGMLGINPHTNLIGITMLYRVLAAVLTGHGYLAQSRPMLATTMRKRVTMPTISRPSITPSRSVLSQ